MTALAMGAVFLWGELDGLPGSGGLDRSFEDLRNDQVVLDA